MPASRWSSHSPGSQGRSLYDYLGKGASGLGPDYNDTQGFIWFLGVLLSGGSIAGYFMWLQDANQKRAAQDLPPLEVTPAAKVWIGIAAAICGGLILYFIQNVLLAD